MTRRPSRSSSSAAARAFAAALWFFLATSPVGAAVAATPEAPPAFRAPYRPSSDAEVIQPVPKASDPDVARIRMLRQRLDANPRALDVANDLARAYVDFGRRVGDAHYVGYAEAAIGPWLSGARPPVATLILDATILQYRHQFGPAREQLKRALAIDGANAQAWLTLATLDMVQGDYPTASRDCAEVARAGDPVVGVACSANLASYLGQAKRSVELLRTLAAQGDRLRTPIASWVEGLLAESAERLGDWPAVEAHYRRALVLAPDDNFLLVAYADFLLDRDRPAEVLALLGDEPQSDTAYLRIVLARERLKSPDLARSVWLMAARFEALAQRGDDLFGREQVRFALYGQHDAAAALALAQQNWVVQRAPWDARVYLEAALAANQPAAALPALRFVDETHLEDPMIEPIARALRARLAKPPT